MPRKSGGCAASRSDPRGAAASAGIVLDNTTHAVIENNYIHDMIADCISLMAFNSGESIDGSVIAWAGKLERC
jgi:hypothetical protein